MKNYDYAIKTSNHKPFGRHFVFDIPKKCDLIIVCKNNGSGYQPFRCLLPHQLYQKSITRLLEEECDIRQITIFPVRNKDAIDLLQGWR